MQTKVMAIYSLTSLQFIVGKYLMPEKGVWNVSFTALKRQLWSIIAVTIVQQQQCLAGGWGFVVIPSGYKLMQDLFGRKSIHEKPQFKYLLNLGVIKVMLSYAQRDCHNISRQFPSLILVLPRPVLEPTSFPFLKTTRTVMGKVIPS